jgi:TIR domain
MPVILISYRRADSKEVAKRIHEQLVARYGKKSVYIDIDSILLSADYRVHITQALERALVMVTVIGKDWAGPRAEGKPRIFDQDDPVRAEVETAFANHRSVLPVLVNGAGMPMEADLPESLGKLPYLNALVVRSGDEFSSDMERLFHAIGQLSVQFWTLFASAYLVLPFALVLLSQYLILFKIDTSPMYLRLAITAIATALGIGLCFHIRFRTIATLVTAAAVGFVSAVGMIAAVTALSSSTAPFSFWNFVPQGARDWQEVVEYFTIITAVTLSANVMGWLYRDRRTHAMIARHGSQRLPTTRAAAPPAASVQTPRSFDSP